MSTEDRSIDDKSPDPAIKFEQPTTIFAPPPTAEHVLVEDLPAFSSSRTRYTRTRIQGEGGIGRVWLARDQDLRREVALKELKDQSPIGIESQRRFLREAQITGQLEHPNIIPVYELGHWPDTGNPFYTMRFVRGRSLRDVIAEYHANREGANADPLALPRLLNVFVSVCNAIGYAHSRGVVHRDLKPDNIVVGSFGEVNVLDWGLAKLIAQPDEPQTVAAPNITAQPMEETRLGSILGTPAYMAPEQAEGNVEQIDARTDVYGLGTILFRIITGRLPHEGKSTAEMLWRISRGQIRRAREVAPNIPKSLDAICAKAMAPVSAERYASASALADDVQRYLADEPVSVLAEPWHERLARWARRHRSAVRAAAAALLTITMVSLAATALVDNARRRESKALAAEADAKRDALRRLAQTRSAVDTLLTGVSDGLQEIPGAQRVRDLLLNEASATYAELANNTYRDASLQMEAAWSRFRLGQVRRQLHGVTDGEADVHMAQAIFLNLLGESPGLLDARYGAVTCQIELARMAYQAGRVDEAKNAYKRAVTELGELLTSSHAPREWRAQLGRTYLSWTEVQIRLGDDPQLDLGRLVEVFDTLAAQAAHDSEYRYEAVVARRALAQQYGIWGSPDKAIETLEEAHRELELLQRSAPGKTTYFATLAQNRLDLGLQLRAIGRYEEADQAIESAVRDLNMLVEREPEVPSHRLHTAYGITNWATVLERLGRLERAEEVLRVARAEFEELIQNDPSAAHVEGRAVAELELARVLANRGSNDEAATLCRSAVSVFEELATDNAVPVYREQRAVAQCQLGSILLKLADPGARELIAGGIAEFEQLVEASPWRRSYRANLAQSRVALAWLDFDAARTDQAKDGFRQALAMFREPVTTRPAMLEYAHQQIQLLITCPFDDLRDAELARQTAQQIATISPTSTIFRVDRGAAEFRLGQFREAIDTLRPIVDSGSPGDRSADWYLAMALERDGNRDESRRYFEKALEWQSKNRPDEPHLLRLRRETEAVLGIMP